MIRPNKTVRDQIKIKIDGKEIVQQLFFKLLGVEIDDKLNFSNHVGMLIRRVRQTQAAVRRVGRRFPKALGAMLINAILVSRMTYGSANEDVIARQEELPEMKEDSYLTTVCDLVLIVNR